MAGSCSRTLAWAIKSGNPQALGGAGQLGGFAELHSLGPAARSNDPRPSVTACNGGDMVGEVTGRALSTVSGLMIRRALIMSTLAFVGGIMVGWSLSSVNQPASSLTLRVSGAVFAVVSILSGHRSLHFFRDTIVRLETGSRAGSD